jgi:hypothetical protein
MESPLAPILRQACAKRTSRRYQTADQMLRHIEDSFAPSDLRSGLKLLSLRGTGDFDLAESDTEQNGTVPLSPTGEFGEVSQGVHLLNAAVAVGIASQQLELPPESIPRKRSQRRSMPKSPLAALPVPQPLAFDPGISTEGTLRSDSELLEQSDQVPMSSAELGRPTGELSVTHPLEVSQELPHSSGPLSAAENISTQLSADQAEEPLVAAGPRRKLIASLMATAALGAGAAVLLGGGNDGAPDHDSGREVADDIGADGESQVDSDVAAELAAALIETDALEQELSPHPNVRGATSFASDNVAAARRSGRLKATDGPELQ